MIASAVMLLLIGSVGAVFTASIRYYKRTQAQVDLETSALIALKMLSRDLSESSIKTVEVEPAGVVFATLRNADGGYDNDADGEIYWQGLLCYAVEPLNGNPALIRYRRQLGLSGNPHDPLSQIPIATVATFVGSADPKRLMATGVSAFTIAERARESATSNKYLEIGLTLNTNDRGPDANYTIAISTRAFPRN